MAETRITPFEAWPTVLFFCDWPEHETHRAALESHIRALAADFDQPLASRVATSAKSAEGLVESPLNFFELSDEPALAALRDWIEACLRHVVSGMNGSAVPPERLRVEFTESWFHITNDGGFHDAHTHGACSWCGIFYLASGDSARVPGTGAETAGNGVNRFYGPHNTGGIVRDYGNAYLGRSYVDVEPQEGRLVLFPSYLLHSALPYRGATDRIIISFNSRTHRA